jgi:Ca2+-binding RTX toxin-like protein
VESTASFTLGQFIESLYLMGTDDIDGVGNAGNNTLRGNAGVNTLDGGAGQDRLEGGAGGDVLLGGSGGDVLIGGAGDDSLTGGAGSDRLTGGVGNDVFNFDMYPWGLTGVDTITDFHSGSDVLSLVSAAFPALVGSNFFRAGAGVTVAHSLHDHLLYDTNTGNLYYDRDGTGAAPAVLFAVLQGHPALTAADIAIE